MLRIDNNPMVKSRVRETEIYNTIKILKINLSDSTKFSKRNCKYVWTMDEWHRRRKSIKYLDTNVDTEMSIVR